MDWFRLLGLLVIPLTIGGLVTAAILRREVFKRRAAWAFVIGYMITVGMAFAGSVPSTAPGIAPICFLVYAICYSARARLKRKEPVER